jgi:hypothetical protein
MIARFFRKKPKDEPPARKKAHEEPIREKKPAPSQKILTAEGWKRMMMRKSNKGKKSS